MSTTVRAVTHMHPDSGFSGGPYPQETALSVSLYLATEDLRDLLTKSYRFHDLCFKIDCKIYIDLTFCHLLIVLSMILSIDCAIYRSCINFFPFISDLCSAIVFLSISMRVLLTAQFDVLYIVI
jgi:hypothetical protein